VLIARYFYKIKNKIQNRVRFFLRVWLFMSLSMVLQAQPVPSIFAELDNASLFLLNAQHQVVMAKHADKAMIPASTTKLMTAFLALQHWGAEHRFHTNFYLSHTANHEAVLMVKGYGDPFLISEEIEHLAKTLAQRLKAQKIESLSHLVLNTDYFQANVILPGHSSTQNPYDAIPSVLAANFNTLNVEQQQGILVSAEPQTPLTPVARAWAMQPEVDLSQGRVNLGAQAKRCENYFAELLSHFLSKEGIRIQGSVVWGSLPADQSHLIYQHDNSHTLAELIQPMMRYSTNFIANQLALILSAERYGAPATAEKVAKMFQEEIIGQFGWQDFKVEDGAGLSRQNRLSAKQLVMLLQKFKPWRHLLPEIMPQVVAKSGTLIGVTTLAGYIEVPISGRAEQLQWAPFALLINEPASYHTRNQITQRLKTALASQSLVSAP